VEHQQHALYEYEFVPGITVEASVFVRRTGQYDFALAMMNERDFSARLK